jgi:sulfate adenylyltransferase subunit 1
LTDIRHGFVHGHLKARCEVFEEYYYSLGDLSINKINAQDLSYSIGDTVPLQGRSYRYPEFFDIIIFRDNMVIQIRSGQVAAILSIADYDYQGLPLVNGRGFGLLVHSADEWSQARADFEKLTPENESELSRRWLDFNTYRRIPIGFVDFSI